ncbi:MAG: DUF4384 domain-containing protein [Gallionella sp.]|nr:DUF4384 domain-containing protein [Gallionella sp.]
MHSFKKIVLAVALSCLLCQTSITCAEEDNKNIRVRESQAMSGKTIELSVAAAKKQFKVGEPVRFKVRGNHDYYLYVYNLDPASGESVLLLPNKKIRSNLFKGGKSYTLPRGVEFFGDSVGNEHLMFIASAEKIDLDSANIQSAGDFGKASTKDLEGVFSKSISIRDTQPGRGNGSASLTVKIVD